MSREIRRVPLDFDYPLGETWHGFIPPETLLTEPCAACGGAGSHEKYPGQREDAKAWKPTPPPTGDGYQLWQTVSQGGPVSPVFATPAELATWIRTEGDEFDGRNTPYDQLVAWIAAEGVSVGTLGIVAGRGVVSGVELAAEHLARERVSDDGSGV